MSVEVQTSLIYEIFTIGFAIIFYSCTIWLCYLQPKIKDEIGAKIFLFLVGTLFVLGFLFLKGEIVFI